MPKAVQTMPKLVQVMPKMVHVMPLIGIVIKIHSFFPKMEKNCGNIRLNFRFFIRMTLTECGMLDRRADRPVRTMAACEIIFDTARTLVRITTKNFRRESTRQYIARAASEATNTV